MQHVGATVHDCTSFLLVVYISRGPEDVKLACLSALACQLIVLVIIGINGLFYAVGMIFYALQMFQDEHFILLIGAGTTVGICLLLWAIWGCAMYFTQNDVDEKNIQEESTLVYVQL